MRSGYLVWGAAIFAATTSVFPWWGLIVAGFILGFAWPEIPRLGVATVCFGALSWLIPAGLADFAARGHISLTVGGLAGVQSSVFGYLIIALIGALLAGLGSRLGVSTRAVVLRPKRRWRDRRQEEGKTAG